MLSRRIDLSTELPLEDLRRLEARIHDVMLATREEGLLIPPSRITLRGESRKARREAERIRYKYVIIAYEPENRREAIEAMKCPFIDVISLPPEKLRILSKPLVHVARINNKYIEISLRGAFERLEETIKSLMKARHRASVRYAKIYFGSGARSKEERRDSYALSGFLRMILRYDLLKLSSERQRELLKRNRDKLEGFEIFRGVKLSGEEDDS